MEKVKGWMRQVTQSRILSNIVSPCGLAIISYALFLFGCLIPPSFYSYYIHEPDLMFLDPVVILFYTLCVVGFLAGVWFLGWLLPPVSTVNRQFLTKAPPAFFLLIPLVPCVLLTGLASVLVVKDNPLVIPILMAREGNRLTLGGDASLQLKGTMNISVLFVTGIVWWSVWRYHQLGIAWRGRLAVRIVHLLAVLVVLIASTLMLSKHIVTVLVTGLALGYLIRKTIGKQLNWNVVAKTTFVFVLGGAFVFFLVTSLRGALDFDTQIESFLGYTIASYNRLAALLHGTLHFEYSERGIYFSNFLSFNNSFNRIIRLREVMGYPDYFSWWMSSFASVGRAGLHAQLIFCGTFGEIFIEIGWLAPLYVFGYGLLYGLVWRWMIAGRLIGIVLYPYFAYCVLFWFSTNGLLDQDIVALIIDALALAVYEVLFVKQRKVLIEIPEVA
jgi:hypothetical protein